MIEFWSKTTKQQVWHVNILIIRVDATANISTTSEYRQNTKRCTEAIIDLRLLYGVVDKGCLFQLLFQFGIVCILNFTKGCFNQCTERCPQFTTSRFMQTNTE